MVDLRLLWRVLIGCEAPLQAQRAGTASLAFVD
jgi:hypothetical protein